MVFTWKRHAFVWLFTYVDKAGDIGTLHRHTYIQVITHTYINGGHSHLLARCTSYPHIYIYIHTHTHMHTLIGAHILRKWWVLTFLQDLPNNTYIHTYIHMRHIHTCIHTYARSYTGTQVGGYSHLFKGDETLKQSLRQGRLKIRYRQGPAYTYVNVRISMCANGDV